MYSSMTSIDDLLAHRGDRIGDVLGGHQLVALLVDDLALVVGDVVVLEQVLADVEVVRLHLALRALDLPRQHAALDRLALAHAERAASCALVRSGSPKMRIRLSSSDR